MKKHIAGCLGILVAFAAAAADDLRLNVKVVSQQLPSDVVLERDDSVLKQAFSRNPATGVYAGALPRSAIHGPATVKLVSPFRLVVGWEGTDSEQLFLGLRYPVPETLDLSFYRDQTAFDEAAVNAIDKLPSDLESQLRKYFRSKAFHKHWRYTKTDPENYLALRSARIWFDAAVGLVNRVNSPFRMDPEVVSVMDEYEQKAKSNSRFRDRYRKYAQPGYVAATLQQVDASDFAVVSRIPALIAAGKIEEAGLLNATALEALNEAGPDLRQAVLKHQRIDLQVLRKNEASLK